MGKNKLIIRLIDVVFILLFAFIAVSQIDTMALIEPPKSTEASAGKPSATYTLIIGVHSDGSYLLENGVDRLGDSAQLRRYLRAKLRETADQGKQLGVRIRAQWDSPVEYGMKVAEICRELGINKGLDVVQYYSN